MTHNPLHPRVHDRVDRRVGWLIAIGGAALVLIAATEAAERWHTMQAWWNWMSVALLALVVLLAVAGNALPIGMLRRIWAAAPIAYLVLLGLWAAACSPDALASASPWIWEIEATMACLLILVRRWWTAVACVLVSALLAPAASWAMGGLVSPAVLEQTPIHLGNVAFVAIFVAIRRQLAELWSAEEEAARQERLRALARAEVVEQQRLATVVHDEVLSTLSVAAHAPPSLAPELAAQAQRAQLVIGRRISMPDRARPPVPAADVAERLAARARDVLPAVVLHTWAGTGTVPAVAAEAAEAAAAEALRNADRHARDPRTGIAARVVVEVAVDHAGLLVEVDDDGPGFVPADVSAARVGIAHSIVDRMQRVPGGAAAVRSGIGQGTTVTLRWRP